MSLNWSEQQFLNLGYNPAHFKDFKARTSGHTIHSSLNDQQSLIRTLRDRGLEQVVDQGLIELMETKDPSYKMLTKYHNLQPLPEIPREKEEHGIFINQGFLIVMASLEILDLIS